MSDATAKVFEALRSIDVPEDKAIAAAAALSRPDEEIVTKSFLRAELSELRSDFMRLQIGLFMAQVLTLIGVAFTIFRLLAR